MITRGPAGSMRELPRLVVEVALVVGAIPIRVLLHAAPERNSELRRAVGRRIELDDERAMLRVDQVVGAGAPIWLTSGARTDEANAIASGL